MPDISLSQFLDLTEEEQQKAIDLTTNRKSIGTNLDKEVDEKEIKPTVRPLGFSGWTPKKNRYDYDYDYNHDYGYGSDNEFEGFDDDLYDSYILTNDQEVGSTSLSTGEIYKHYNKETSTQGNGYYLLEKTTKMIEKKLTTKEITMKLAKKALKNGNIIAYIDRVSDFYITYHYFWPTGKTAPAELYNL